MGTDAWNEHYEKSYSEGYVIGQAKIMAQFIRKFEENPTAVEEEILKSLFAEQPGYYDEIKNIIHKYPNYDMRHLAKKVIFESTWLPYTISEYVDKMP